MKECLLCKRDMSKSSSCFGKNCLKKSYEILGLNMPRSKKEDFLFENLMKKNGISNLNENQKIWLADREIALQLLNKVPLKSYDNARKDIANDIKNIKNNSDRENETVLTLKQVYDIFKLYNKFQKIINKSEEVDSEFIQNYLFDNLLFAFSTYYKNKKFLGGVIADIQYYFWKLVILRYGKKYPNGTEFIEYSLQEKPKDRIIIAGRIIEDIKCDGNFKEKLNMILQENIDNKQFDVTYGLDYKSSDLFLALNNTTLNVIGKKEDTKWKLNITITDRYDFTDFKEIDEYCDDDRLKGILGSTANNLAMVSAQSGVMHEYNVTIKFNIECGDAYE